MLVLMSKIGFQSTSFPTPNQENFKSSFFLRLRQVLPFCVLSCQMALLVQDAQKDF